MLSYSYAGRRLWRGPALLLALSGCHDGKGASSAQSLPEVGVATIAPARSASRTIQRTRRSGRRGRTAAARKRLSAARRLQGRRPGCAGRAAVRDRPAPVPDRARSRQRAAAAARAAASLANVPRRVQTLIDAHATSQEELDNARATAEQARDPQAADAAVADAKLNLGFTEVRAPIAGRVGRAVATVGNPARADDTLLTTVVSQNPVYVFRLRRTELPALQRAARRSETSRDRRRSGARGPRERDGLPACGHRRLPRQPARPATGTIRARVRLPNEDHTFTPGLYARVQLVSGREYMRCSSTTRPCSPTRIASTYVIGPGDKALRRDVTIGRGWRASGSSRRGSRRATAWLSTACSGSTIRARR